MTYFLATPRGEAAARALRPIACWPIVCWPIVSCLFAVVLAACGGDANSQARAFEPPYRLDPQDRQRMLVRPDLANHLETTPATSSNIAADIVGFGRLGFAPDASYSVRVPFASYVERVLVDVDDAVTEGQPLAELRSSELAQVRAELANSSVAVRVEEGAIARLQPLVEDGTASERELIEARARLEAARATVAGARASLSAAGASAGRGDRYVLRATAPGRVLARNVAPGERTSGDDEAAFMIGDPEQIVVRAAFPERDAVFLREGAPCQFTVNALTGSAFDGRIVRIVRSVDPQTRSTRAVCQPTEHDPRFQAQMVVRVSVSVEGEEQVVVPRSALLLRRDDHVVFVRVDEGVLERRRVEPGLHLGDRVQIVEGIAAGESVVTAGAVLLDGQLDVLL